MAPLVQKHGADLLRYKGTLRLSGNRDKVAFQGVHMIMGGDHDRPRHDGEVCERVLVFMGRDLPEHEFRAAWAACTRNLAASTAGAT